MMRGGGGGGILFIAKKFGGEGGFPAATPNNDEASVNSVVYFAVVGIRGGVTAIVAVAGSRRKAWEQVVSCMRSRKQQEKVMEQEESMVRVNAGGEVGEKGKKRDVG